MTFHRLFLRLLILFYLGEQSLCPVRIHGNEAPFICCFYIMIILPGFEGARSLRHQPLVQNKPVRTPLLR